MNRAQMIQVLKFYVDVCMYRLLAFRLSILWTSGQELSLNNIAFEIKKNWNHSITPALHINSDITIEEDINRKSLTYDKTDWDCNIRHKQKLEWVGTYAINLLTFYAKDQWVSVV